MVAAFLRCSALGTILLLVAGCGSSGGGPGGGGGGGGGGGNPTVVTVTFSGPAPTAVATKIGSGSFTATTVSSGAVSVSLTSGTTDFAIAYACPAYTNGIEQNTSQYVDEATTMDGTSYTFVCPYSGSVGQTGTLTASVDASAISGVSLTIDAQNGFNFTEDYSIPPPFGNVSFAAPVGSDFVDILAYSQNPSEGGAVSLAGVKVLSGQTVPGSLNGGNPVVFTAADAVTPEPITYNGVPSGFEAPFFGRTS